MIIVYLTFFNSCKWTDTSNLLKTLEIEEPQVSSDICVEHLIMFFFSLDIFESSQVGPIRICALIWMMNMDDEAVMDQFQNRLGYLIQLYIYDTGY